jgi:hypothetical protein
LAQSFRNRSALSGYIDREVKPFFRYSAKKALKAAAAYKKTVLKHDLDGESA